MLQAIDVIDALYGEGAPEVQGFLLGAVRNLSTR
jgi:hypothetical protein